MTPTQHRDAVATFIARTTAVGYTPPIDDEYLAAEVHAHLGGAAGTGAAYTAADTLLTDALAAPVGSRRTDLRKALIHAIGADR